MSRIATLEPDPALVGPPTDPRPGWDVPRPPHHRGRWGSGRLREAVPELLRTGGPMTAVRIAGELGSSKTTIRGVLRASVDCVVLYEEAQRRGPRVYVWGYRRGAGGPARRGVREEELAGLRRLSAVRLQVRALAVDGGSDAEVDLVVPGTAGPVVTCLTAARADWPGPWPPSEGDVVEVVPARVLRVESAGAGVQGGE
jgi:hypothetical protein